MKCPLCRNNTNQVFNFYNFPLNLPPSKNKILNLSNLKVYNCKPCDFLFNEYRDAKFYENLYSNQISYVKPKIKSNWTNIIIEKNYKNILEIGGGSNPIGNYIPSKIKSTVVDPYISDNSDFASNIKIFEGKIEDFSQTLNNSSENNLYDAIFMSHTLEHISDLQSLIDIISKTNSLKYADLLIEIPNIYQYTISAPFYTFFFEHCSLFTPYSLYTYLEKYLYKINFFKYASNNDKDLMFIFSRNNISDNYQISFEPQTDLIINSFKKNIKRITNSFIKRLLMMKSKKIIIENAGGGSASLFLYYLKNQRPDLIDNLYLTDKLLNGYFVSSTGQKINNKIDCHFPIIKILDN